MTKQERIKELDELIAKAQAEREQLAKEKTLWVPSTVPYAIHGDGCIEDASYSGYAEFGHAAPTQEKAEQLRDFFAELVPKHPMPEVGDVYWVLDWDFLEAVHCTWASSQGERGSYNLGMTWDHEPTPEEVERKRNALCFNSSWRWV